MVDDCVYCFGCVGRFFGLKLFTVVDACVSFAFGSSLGISWPSINIFNWAAFYLYRPTTTTTDGRHPIRPVILGAGLAILMGLCFAFCGRKWASALQEHFLVQFLFNLTGVSVFSFFTVLQQLDKYSGSSVL